MMREIVLDTETTGLDPAEGHRIVEIGAVELVNHLPTGRVWQTWLDPERDMPAGAERVHGLSAEFLRGKPLFATQAGAFLDFLGDARLVIHNAAFDLGFLNAELARAARPPLPVSRAIDTVEIARRRFPGATASLDALCRRFGVDNSARTRHGALLDAEILAEVYLHLIGGRQPGLGLDPGPAQGGARRGANPAAGGTAAGPLTAARPRALPPRLTAEDRTAHAAFLASLGAVPLWR
jgi:DNA polymerase-3 subunit epsilon